MNKNLFAVVIVIFNEYGAVLSVARKTSDDDINFPGGKIDPGESPIDAIVRETYEETGYKIDSSLLEEVFTEEDCDGNLCAAFLYKDIVSSELIKEYKPEGEGRVRWMRYYTLCMDTSTYRMYNINLRKKLIDYGFKHLA